MTIDSYEAIIATLSDAEASTALQELEQKLDSQPVLQTLIDTYLRDGISLVLGAGVSSSCGAPSWTELLLRLHAANAKVGGVDLSKISSVYAEAVASDGPLISARLAASGINDDSSRFKGLLRTEIYSQLTATRSDLVRELARLAQACEGHSGVRGLVTYNYDTLIEDEFDELGRHYTRLDRTDRGVGHGIQVRHVHGFLGRSELPDEWVVLTERAYHKEYASPFSWSNIVQLNAFRESSCVFVGLSMTDPNLRRLLEAAKQTATPQHYCFLRKTSTTALQNNLDAAWQTRGRGKGKPAGKEWEQVEVRFRVAAAMADASRAAALLELGVHTIWYEDHDKLPPLIKSVREGKHGGAT
ncbi:MAG: SIR2 family protein [Myxococcales bacterium]|nr:SIR2 family protein [Myxococcales bacterium]